MANYGFKTGNESPLQHEMRKENAAEQKPSPSSQWTEGGWGLRERLRGKFTHPHTALCEQTHRGHRQGERGAGEVGRAPSLRRGAPLHTRPEHTEAGGQRPMARSEVQQ